jgi:hypothetical protein
MNPHFNFRQRSQIDFRRARAKVHNSDLREQLVNPRPNRQRPLANWLTFGVSQRVLKSVQKAQFVTSEQDYSCAIDPFAFWNTRVQKAPVRPACRAGPALTANRAISQAPFQPRALLPAYREPKFTPARITCRQPRSARTVVATVRMISIRFISLAAELIQDVHAITSGATVIGGVCGLLIFYHVVKKGKVAKGDQLASRYRFVGHTLAVDRPSALRALPTTQDAWQPGGGFRRRDEN